MSSDVKWYVEGKILFVTHSGKLGVDDAEFFIKECLERFTEADSQVHVVVNHSGTEAIAADLAKVNRLAEVGQSFFTHEQLGVMVAYGIESRLIRFFATMAGQLSKKEYRLVDTFDDAIRLIQKVDLSVTESLPSS